MKALLEILKALYSIKDAIINKKNNGGEEQNNGGEGNDDVKLITGEGFLFYDPKETIVPKIPSDISEGSNVLSAIYNEEEINTIKDIFKRALDCLEYNEGFRKYFFEDNSMSDSTVFDIWSVLYLNQVCVSNGLTESNTLSLTRYLFRITNNSFNFILKTGLFGSESAIYLRIDFSNDYLFYNGTTGKYIWEIEGFDVDTLINGNTSVNVSFM